MRIFFYLISDLIQKKDYSSYIVNVLEAISTIWLQLRWNAIYFIFLVKTKSLRQFLEFQLPEYTV